MKILVCTIAALACLTAAPSLITPAHAQVSIGVGHDGPRLRVDSEDRAMYRGENRGRHYGRRDSDECRDVTVRTRHRDGSVSVSTTRRCD
jgi:hypothetical protein